MTSVAAASLPKLVLISPCLLQQNDKTTATPPFLIGTVQFPLPSPLLFLSCKSNIFVLAVAGIPRPNPPSNTSGQSPQLIRIDLDEATKVEYIDLPLPPPLESRKTGLVSSIHAVHVDPTGRHVVVSTTGGDNFYIFIGATATPHLQPSSNSSRRVKPLTRLKGAVINAISWSSSSSSSSAASFSTREILLGTATGQILETTLLDPTLAETSAFSLPVPGRSGSVERYVKLLYTLPDRQAITGLRCETWGKRAAVIATTQTRIYQFIGSLSGRREEDGGMLGTLFQPYTSGEVQPSSFDSPVPLALSLKTTLIYKLSDLTSESLELPGEPQNSELHFFASQRTDSNGVVTGMGLPKSVAWLTGE